MNYHLRWHNDRAVLFWTRMQVPAEFQPDFRDRSKSRAKCSKIEQLNIDCDEDAEQCVQSGTQPLPFNPLPGSKCMVKINGKWVSSRLDKDKAIQYRTSSKDLEEYLSERLKIDHTTVQDIDRKAMGMARSQVLLVRANFSLDGYQ